MERSIEDSNHRSLFAEYFLAGLHRGSLRRIVQRAKLGEGEDILNNLIGNQGRLLVNFAAVQHAMADCGDLGNVINDLALTGGENGNYFQESLFVGRESDIFVNLAAVSGLVTDVAHLQADTFAVAFCQYTLIGHIDELIFQRRAAGVDNQDFH